MENQQPAEVTQPAAEDRPATPPETEAAIGYTAAKVAKLEVVNIPGSRLVHQLYGGRPR